jgi:hypothetical protein
LLGEFIVDVKFKMNESEKKRILMLFVEELRKMEMFEKLVESGDEETI